MWEFAIGVLASLVATYIAMKTQNLVKRLREPIVKIEGTWAEYIPDSSTRQYSIGEIRFDKKKGLYVFNGTNYNNNGDRFCHWETLTSYLDTESRKFFYTFSAQLEGSLDTVYYGFGVINLLVRSPDQALVPMDGHYVSAKVDGKGMSHSMVSAVGMMYSRTARGDDVIRFLDKHHG